LNKLHQPSVDQRIVLLDVLRGFAIFGIFVVNIEIMNCFLVEADSCYDEQTGLLDRLADEIRRLFFYTKFFPIFSMLFGLGVGIQIMSRARKGFTVWPFIGRRMTWLFLFGIAHILLLWTGDVIHLYAIIGLAGPLLFRLSARLLLYVSVFILLVFPWASIPLYDWIATVMNSLGLDGLLTSFSSDYPQGEIGHIMREGSYGEQVLLRSREYWTNAPMIWSYFAPLALSMFVLGLSLARSGVYLDLPAFARRIRKPVLILAVATNLFRIFFLYVVLDKGWHRMEGVGPILLGIMPVCDVLMGLLYLWLIAYFFPKFARSKLSLGLAAVGRTALSNYILQSVIGMLLVSSIGLGMYGSLTKWDSLLIALSVFPIQAGLSIIWLRRFRFGPLEWAWRCLTYIRYFPLKRQL
jgi:uncharacterized protein